MRALVDRLETQADFVLCEGVMGLFDGTGPDGEAGSTAALARLTGWPVVLVVDARRQGASAAALVAGFARHDPAMPLAGVIFNRVAGSRHLALLEAALARHLPALPCLGAVMQDPALGLPERHLGLVPAGERQSGTEAAIARAADAVAAGLDIERLMSLARPASAGEPQSGGPAIAAARPPYRGGARRRVRLRLSERAERVARGRGGAVVLLAARRSGAGPGGRRRLPARRLSRAARRPARRLPSGSSAGLRQAAGERKAIYGECGGYMVLGETLTASDGGVHRMAGLLPLATSFAERRLHLGYREATLLAAGPLGKAGARFRGHEFHYATTVSEGEAAPLFAVADSCGADLGPAGLRRGSVTGSFIHLIDRAAD